MYYSSLRFLTSYKLLVSLFFIVVSPHPQMEPYFWIRHLVHLITAKLIFNYIYSRFNQHFLCMWQNMSAVKQNDNLTVPAHLHQYKWVSFTKLEIFPI
jgi:hypothetical protein